MKKIIIYVLLLAFGKTFAQDTKVTITGGAIGGSGIRSVTAQNGLSNVNDSTIKLGGTLIENTAINGDYLNSLTFYNLPNFTAAVLDTTTFSSGDNSILNMLPAYTTLQALKFTTDTTIAATTVTLADSIFTVESYKNTTPISGFHSFLNVLPNSVELKRQKIVNAITENVNPRLVYAPDTLSTTPTMVYVKDADTMKVYSISALGGGTVTSVTGTSPIVITSTPTTTPNVTITAMDATHAGYVAAGGSASKVLHGDGTWKDTTAEGGITALSAIGSTPNANGASITGVTLNLQPASASFGGVVTTGIQTIVGDKTLTGVTTVNNLTEYITPQFYGADSTGVVDATIAVQKTIDTASRYNKKVLFNGNYKVSALTVPSNTYIIGVSDSATGLYTVSNAPVLSIRGNNVILKNFIIKGDSTGGASSIQAGVQVDSIPVSTKFNIDIDGLRFKGLNRGYYGYKNGANYGGVRLHDCFIDSCSIGIFTDVQSEYNHFTNNMINACSIGFKNAGGNNMMTSSVIQNSTVGVWIVGGGTNDSHSMMVGNTINSSVTYCVLATGVQFGYTFSSCVFMGTAGGPVLIQSSIGIKFVGCDFRTLTGITVTSSTSTEFDDNKFLTTPTVTLTSSSVVWFGNQWISGVPTGINDNSVNASLGITNTMGLSSANAINDAFVATNTTTPSSGNQMYGGFFHSTGLGWKTNSTAGGQSVDFRWGTVPVQGAAAPSGLLNFESSINGAAYNTVLALANPGNLTNNIMTLTALTIPDSKSAFAMSATMPTTMTGFTKAVDWQITSAGSSAQVNDAFNVEYLAGYTGASRSIAGRIINNAAGTATTIFSANGNLGIFTASQGTTVGTNAGIYTAASNGNVNYGVFSVATTTKNSATNIGLAGFGINAGTSPIEIGVFAGLMGAAPTYTSAALMADNGTEAQPIFVARDNGTVKFSIVDGGNPTLALGNKLVIGTGSNASVGTATLTGGTVTVSTTAVTASSIIFLTDATTGALTNIGTPTVGTIVAGTSFVINSTNILDASAVNWIIIN